MRALVRAAVEHPTVINVLMFGLLLVGWVVTTNIPRESFPKVDLDLIDVRVVWPGHTPEEVEEAIIIKIEEAVHAVEGVDTLTGTAGNSSGRVTIELKRGADARKALDDVRNAVSEIPTFPTDIEPPVVRALTNRQRVISVILHGDVSARSMRDLAERTRDELLDLPDVTQATIKGLRDRELSIEIRPEKLEELGLTLDMIRLAVRSENLEMNSGTLRTAQEDIVVMAGERGYTASELERIPIRNAPGGAEILLRDVADVNEREVERTYLMRFNGERASLIEVQKTEGEDTVQIVSAVKSFVEHLPDRLPPGMGVQLWRDRTVILHQRIDLLTRNGLVGLILIFAALWLFTQLKLSMWVAAGLPVAVLGSAILIHTTGTTINMISLFGLLLVSGILVDDAIVVSENVYAHIERGLSPHDAAIEGTVEVFPAVTASILTTIVAFIPFFFMGGHIGKFVRAIPIVVICCLILSFVESIIILPPHLAHSLQPTDAKGATVLGRLRNRLDRLLDVLLRKPYALFLRRVLTLRWQMVAFGLALLLVTLGFIQGGFIKFVFFPDLDSDNIQLEYLLEPGAPEAVNAAIAERAEQAAEAVHQKVTAEQTDNMPVILGRLTIIGEKGSEHGIIRVALLPGEDRDAGANDIARLWREELGPVPEARWLTAGPARRGPFGKPVHVELLSRSQEDLEDAAERLKEAIAGYPGAYDISDDLIIGKRELIVELTDRGRAAGMTVQQVAAQLRGGIFGARVEVLQRGRDELEVWVRFPQTSRESFGQLNALRVRTPSGADLALSDVARWRSGRGLDVIKRYNRRRKVTVSAAVDVAVGTPEDILDDLRERVLPDLLRDYPDMHASFEGQTRERRKMISGFQKALPWALVGMFAILVLVFQSYAQAALVILIIPLGLVGAVIGHVIIGIPLTILSVWGIVALGGILVNDSIVFVAAINRRLAAGEELISAVHAAGVSRFRPILLTTLTTAAGLMPLILEQSRQAQFLIPMAASLAFGLLIGTIFTLGVLPAGFACINDIRRGWTWLWTGRWKQKESLEPAVRRAARRAADAPTA